MNDLPGLWTPWKGGPMSGTTSEQGAEQEWESELIDVTTVPLLALMSAEETVFANAARRLLAEINQSETIVATHSVTAH
jgi:hypothetical protein